MAYSNNIKSITLPIYADPVGSDHYFHLLKAERDLTVLSIDMVSKNAQGAGTATLLRAENWGTAGTAVEGTVCAYVGGTAVASQLGALVPEAAVIDTDQDYFEAGEWLVVHYAEEGTGWIANDRLMFTVNYVIGRA